MNNRPAALLALCEFAAPAAVVILNSVLPGSDLGTTISRNEVVCAVMTSVVTYAAYARAMRLASEPFTPPARRAAP